MLVKNGFLRELILRIDQPMIVALQPVLRKLCNLFNPEIEPLALCIRLVLNKMHETSYGEVCSNVSNDFITVRKDINALALKHAVLRYSGSLIRLKCYYKIK